MSDTQVVTIVADADHTIQAFGQPKVNPPQEFTITASAEGGAIITPQGVLSVPAGESVVFTIASEPGFELKSILVDGVEVLVP